MGLIGTHQVGAFTVPVNGTSGDADQVRGNDNELRSKLNAHDSDAGIHLQSGLVAARPVAGSAGRVYFTTDVDARFLFFDDGSDWVEANYARSVAPTITGPISLNAPARIVPVSASEVLTLESATHIDVKGTGAAGQIRLHTNNTQRWAIDAAGALVATGAMAITTTGTITGASVTATGTLTGVTLSISGTGTIGNLLLGGSSIQVSGSNMNVGPSSAHQLLLLTNNIARISITSAGAVDISVAGQTTTINGGLNVIQTATIETLLLNATGQLGFYGTTGQAKKTVTGSRGGNAALASLLTQLAGYGLLTDSSTA